MKFELPPRIPERRSSPPQTIPLVERDESPAETRESIPVASIPPDPRPEAPPPPSPQPSDIQRSLSSSGNGTEVTRRNRDLIKLLSLFLLYLVFVFAYTNRVYLKELAFSLGIKPVTGADSNPTPQPSLSANTDVNSQSYDMSTPPVAPNFANSTVHPQTKPLDEQRPPDTRTKSETPETGSPSQQTSLLTTPDFTAESGVAATPSPIPTTYRVIGVKEGDYLFVRGGPGANYPVVQRIPPKTTGLRIGTGQFVNGTTTWDEISINGVRGWVSAEHLFAETTEEPKTTPQEPVETTVVYWQDKTYNVPFNKAATIRSKISEIESLKARISNGYWVRKYNEIQFRQQSTLSGKKLFSENDRKIYTAIEELEKRRAAANAQLEEMLQTY